MMKTALKILTYLSAVLGTLLFIRPEDNSLKTLLWIPKLLGGALSPILSITGALGASLGLIPFEEARQLLHLNQKIC